MKMSIKPSAAPFLWLAIGTLLLLISNGRWIVPAATWLAPVFLLRFVRNQRPLRGLSCALFAAVVVNLLSWPGMIPLSGALYCLVAGSIGIVFWLPYLADRMLVGRIGGVPGTLVFPLAWTSIEYIYASTNPYASWTSIAYTQYGNLPLVQMASVTGIWGLSFLITWTASVISSMWEAGFLWNKVRSGALLWGATIAGVLLFGGIRLVLSGPVQAVVQAGCVVSSPETHGKPDSAVLASYLERTAGLARAGVKIVSWDEGGICVDQDAEARFVGRAQELVRRERIYLLIGLAVRDPEGRRGHAVNKVAFIDTSGAVVFEHRKYLRLPGEYFSSGDPELRVVRTPYGTLTAAICMDLDDPCYIRQATRLNADILLAPSYDWKEIDPIHTHMASFRSVENGFSLMRATCEGMSAAYDPYGRTLATADYFSSNAASLICFVPTASVDTVYEQTGDAFAWLCITGFLVLLAVAIVGPRKADQRSI